MEAQYWFIAAVAIAAALGLGFAAGRMSAPTQQRVREMENERDTARSEAETVRKEVNRHFEESARMFGKLADDYRSFFQQFARTAQNLGLSEGHARQLLQQADPSLVAAEEPAKADADTPGEEPRGSAESESPTGESPGRDGEAAAAGTGEIPSAAEAGEADPALEPEGEAGKPTGAAESEAETRKP
jgi:uncharacterized membrane-anchored protein YhcB (DUF1043 family)